MTFLSAYNVGLSIGQPECDNTEEPVFSERITDSGMYEVFRSGSRNFQDLINEAYPSTLLENVLARCGVGDFSGFNRNGFYADVTAMPADIHSASSLIKNVKSIFDSLPKDIKNQFNSFSDFLNASNDPVSLVKILNPKKESAPKEESKNESAE